MNMLMILVMLFCVYRYLNRAEKFEGIEEKRVSDFAYQPTVSVNASLSEMPVGYGYGQFSL